MKVQKLSLGAHCYTWLVVGDDYLPIKPIADFLRYLTNLESSKMSGAAKRHFYTLTFVALLQKTRLC